jgi:glycerophosphoryl diester phosphodiesterase
MEIANTASETLPLPTLEDVLRQFADRAFLDIELKVAGLEAQTVVALREHPPQKGYVASSFIPEVLTAIHDLNSAIPLGFLCETRDQLRGWRETPAEWVIPQFALVDRELITLIHGAGKKIMIWTVNRFERRREFAEWGVDAIVTDETERIAESVHAR